VELGRYSFLIGALVFFLYTGYEAWTMQRGTLTHRMLIWAALVLAVVGIWYFLLRPVPSSNIDSVQDMEALIGSGQPALLELYSPY
jgi:hypothetical protein